jgi:hypothetical protein
MNAIPFKPNIAPQSYQSAQNGYFKRLIRDLAKHRACR